MMQEKGKEIVCKGAMEWLTIKFTLGEKGRKDLRGMRGRQGDRINGVSVQTGLKDCWNKEWTEKTGGGSHRGRRTQLSIWRSCSNETGERKRLLEERSSRNCEPCGERILSPDTGIVTVKAGVVLEIMVMSQEQKPTTKEEKWVGPGRWLQYEIQSLGFGGTMREIS